jgi:hypothetical protein
MGLWMAYLMQLTKDDDEDEEEVSPHECGKKKITSDMKRIQY